MEPQNKFVCCGVCSFLYRQDFAKPRAEFHKKMVALGQRKKQKKFKVDLKSFLKKHMVMALEDDYTVHNSVPQPLCREK